MGFTSIAVAQSIVHTLEESSNETTNDTTYNQIEGVSTFDSKSIESIELDSVGGFSHLESNDTNSIYTDTLGGFSSISTAEDTSHHLSNGIESFSSVETSSVTSIIPDGTGAFNFNLEETLITSCNINMCDS